MDIEKKDPQADRPTDISQLLHEIKQKALETYLEQRKNNMPGDAVSAWLQAEEMVKKAHHFK
ncbi:MAG: hypothetical protein HZC28_11450 [Spirochaetes bacterium]|nr:hypothetical protein [Spirochaetota bacterium]